ncbi:MAG: histidine--tRNA ligase [Planctomycetes bacterium]|nr:histidine--tRNA ligase [Planctomycetota bacterium]
MAAITQPPSGMRDLLPEDVRRRERVIGAVRQVYESHGFEPLETPSCERLDVLLGKYGDEGDQLMFRVMHRRDKLRSALDDGALRTDPERVLADMALRYDLTVPLARVVAEHQGKLPRVFKRFQIQPVWRADRPQKGRFREFLQCDLDVAGSSARTVEVEVLSAASEVLQRLGFADFRVRINHRGVLAGMIEAAGIPAELEASTFVAIDKLDKIGRDGVLRELATRGVTAESAASIATMLDPVDGGNDAELARLRTFLAPSPRGLAALDDLAAVLALAAGSPLAARLAVDPSLARGLSYYTGSIFEITVPDLAGSLGGGGRYDGLIGIFLGRDVPACGFSLGLERIIVVMEERGMFGGPTAAADAMVGIFDASLTRDALALARELRETGLRVDLHCDASKIGKQYQDADSRGVPCVALVGPDEVGRGTVSLKWLKTGERAEVPRGEAAAWIRQRLGTT